MADPQELCKILHYSSSICRRITRSLMAVEMDTLFLIFDHLYIGRNMVPKILKQDARLEAFVDSIEASRCPCQAGHEVQKIASS